MSSHLHQTNPGLVEHQCLLLDTADSRKLGRSRACINQATPLAGLPQMRYYKEGVRSTCPHDVTKRPPDTARFRGWSLETCKNVDAFSSDR
jgi:hypothetical protein